MSPPSSRLFLLLELAGVAYRPQHTYPNLIKFYISHMLIMFVIQSLSIMVFWISEDNDWETTAELIHYSIETINVAIKIIIFLFRYKEVRELLKFTDEIWELCKSDPDNQPLLEKSDKSESNISKIVIFGSISVPILFFIGTWLSYKITGLKRLPILYWVPFDSQRYFLSIAAIQTLIYGIPLRIYLCFMGFNITLVTVTVTYMKVLQRMLTTRDAKANTRLSTYILHQKINRLVYLTNELLSGLFLLEISLSAMRLSLRIFMFIKVILTGDGDILVPAGILLLSMSSPFIISYVGEVIKSESEKIFEAAYDNVWYEEEETTKQELMLVLQASLRPHSLHYRQLISFNMEQFGMLLQTTYSYLSVIFGLEI